MADRRSIPWLRLVLEKIHLGHFGDLIWKAVSRVKVRVNWLGGWVCWGEEPIVASGEFSSQGGQTEDVLLVSAIFIPKKAAGISAAAQWEVW